MPEVTREPSTKSGQDQFFKILHSSIWISLCTIIANLLSYAIHFFSKIIPESEYGIVGLSLATVTFLSVPAVGLQMAFAHEAATALDEPKRRELSSLVRWTMILVLVLWLAVALLAVLFQKQLIRWWKIDVPSIFWLILATGLPGMCLPVLSGVLQGKQRFFALGTLSLSHSGTRFFVAATAVFCFASQSGGISGAIFAGIAVSFVLASVLTREVWCGIGTKVKWGSWIRRAAPVCIGFGSFQIMCALDPILIQGWFNKDETGFYMAGVALSRALITLTGGFLGVLFPIFVQRIAQQKDFRFRSLTFGVTAMVVAFGAILIVAAAPFLVRLVYTDRYLPSVTLIRSLTLANAPLAVSNVLLTGLLANNRFQVVPWLTAVNAAYIGSICFAHASFTQVVCVVGVFNVLYLCVVALFFIPQSLRSLAAASHVHT